MSVDHVFDVVGGAHGFFGLLEVQRVHVLQESLDVFFGVLADGDAGSGGVLDDAIVHVGEVHYLEDAEAAEEQEAAQYILEDEGTKIADMSIVVDRGAAAVDADFALVEGVEGLEAAGERVVEAYVGHFQDIGKRTIVAEGRVRGKVRNGNAIADGNRENDSGTTWYSRYRSRTDSRYFCAILVGMYSISVTGEMRAGRGESGARLQRGRYEKNTIAGEFPGSGGHGTRAGGSVWEWNSEWRRIDQQPQWHR